VSDQVPPDAYVALGGLGPGSRVAGYVLEEQVGAGGMAVVFRARDERLDRTVALKILAPGVGADEASRQRFIRESRAAAAVDDPHIIPIYEAGEAGGMLFIAMRYVRGGDARSLVARTGPMQPARVVWVIAQVASALDAAHDARLVHRDVKPANMLLDARPGRPEHVYLSDFGLSKTALAGRGLTSTGQFLGTPHYSAPEQLEGLPLDGRADQYGLAAAAFEFLSGRPPFDRDEMMAVIYAQLSEPPPSLKAQRPELPAAVDEVFSRALAKMPWDRYPTCRAFADALRAALRVWPDDSSERPEAMDSPRISPAAAPADRAPENEQAGVAAIGDQPTRPLAERVPAHRAAASPGQPRGTPVTRAPVRRAWRSPLALFTVAIVLAAAGFGGAYLALHRGGSQTAALAMPPCGNGTAAGADLHGVQPQFSTPSPGSAPFGIVAARDGRFVFTVNPTSVTVLRVATGLGLQQEFSYPLAGTMASQGAAGAALTRNGRYLLVAIGGGIDVLSVAGLEGDEAAFLRTLTVRGGTGNGRGIQVAVTPDGHYAFVALQLSNEVAMFNLWQAASSKFRLSGYDGTLDVGANPVGLSVSADGRWLYTVNHGTGNGRGALSVINIAKAVNHRKAAVVARVTGLCSPARIALSAGTIWVTTRLSNYLLGFSVAQLRTQPGRALVAKVEVGQNPVGVAVVNKGSRIVVADANDLNAGSANLAVIDVASALARKPALLGYLPSRQGARELAVSPSGTDLYVADLTTAQVETVDLGSLP